MSSGCRPPIYKSSGSWPPIYNSFGCWPLIYNSFGCWPPIYTHVKISRLVASLQTSRQQVVFARLATSCQQVWNKLLTTCNNLVVIVRLVTRMFQQGRYNHDITILLQPCVVNLVTFLLYHDSISLVRL